MTIDYPEIRKLRDVDDDVDATVDALEWAIDKGFVVPVDPGIDISRLALERFGIDADALQAEHTRRVDRLWENRKEYMEPDLYAATKAVMGYRTPDERGDGPAFVLPPGEEV